MLCLPDAIFLYGGQIMKNDTSKLAHTTWNCKYHIVLAPKYRHKIFYSEKRLEIVKILKKLCRWQEVEIREGEACADHIHTLPPSNNNGPDT